MATEEAHEAIFRPSQGLEGKITKLRHFIALDGHHTQNKWHKIRDLNHLRYLSPGIRLNKVHKLHQKYIGSDKYPTVYKVERKRIQKETKVLWSGR